jgi:hypothetical protein
MTEAELMALAAPCGIFCGECECHQAAENPALLEFLVSRGIEGERLPCPGCRSAEGNCPVLQETCATYACAQQNKVDFCYDCLDFPCVHLNPAADRADVLPHNLKVFSLCSLKQEGLASWSRKYPELKQRYFRGRMAIGRGPQLQ